MSILIRDMEMPKRCFECPCMGEMFGYFVCLITAKDMRAEHGINISRPDWCPLTELPPLVEDAPTVIEAEGET